MDQQDLIPHLFRTEFRKITAVLCRHFGMQQIELAEDIASDTFVTAFETWPFKGIPANPTAWLYSVAKNKARTHSQRTALFNRKIAGELDPFQTEADEIPIDLSDQNITDSQLRMLFAVCHPSLSAEAQIGLALRILCGFGIDEIANAFLSNRETINKRLFRAREKLRREKVAIELPPPAEIHQRLATVLTTVYLLFNEGYYSESQDAVLRQDFCLEAIRLAYLLTENELTAQPSVDALLALMCFHASRFDARKSSDGGLVLYPDQDESRWNHSLIAQGGYFLQRAARGTALSTYHLEASIAYWHTIKADTPEKWTAILSLFDQLLQLNYSPIAALNRIYALAKVYGQAVAIGEAEKLNLADNPYYFALLGELYRDTDNARARSCFQTAHRLARTAADQDLIQKKLATLN